MFHCWDIKFDKICQCGGVMKRKEIEFEQIITDKDIKRGNLILIAGRPAVGKTEVCSKIVKEYGNEYGYLFFDLSGNEDSYWLKSIKRVIEYHTAVEIIKTIQKEIKNNLKFVFIDYWQLIDNKEDWFRYMLVELALSNKIIIIITSQLSRVVESRKNHLPLNKDLKSISNDIFLSSGKVVVISKPAIYGIDLKKDLHYFLYKDLDT